MKKAPQPVINRKMVGAKLRPDLLRRLDVLCRVSNRNPRQVIELCLDAYLTELEKREQIR